MPRKRDIMAPEYDFTDGIRGKYAADFTRGSNLVLLDPDVAEHFPDGASVNEALRGLVSILARRRRTGKAAASSSRKKEKASPVRGKPHP